MHDSLLNCLSPVISRLRRLRFWRAATVVAWLAVLLAVGMLWFSQTGRDVPAQLIWTLVGSVGLSLLVLWIWTCRSFSNRQVVARQIEDKFPSLNQRLVTALEQPASDESLGYLQRRVMDEARQHSNDHSWGEVVPERSLWRSRMSSLIGGGVLAAVLALIVTLPVQRDFQLGSALPVEPSVVIQPGDVQRERGTNLLVTARWEGHTLDDSLPTDPELVLVEDDGSERRVTMKRNLADPVWGGLVVRLNQSLTYRVESPRWQSEAYRVEVYEYPVVVRSDCVLVSPSYTGMPERRIEDTVRVSAVGGSMVTWVCRLNKAVESASLVTEDGKSIEMTADASDPLTVAGSFELTRTEKMEVRLVDEEGRVNQLPARLTVKMLPNMPPQLKLTQGGDVSVSPLEELSLAADVRDDFGIVASGLSITFADEPSEDIVLSDSSTASSEKSKSNSKVNSLRHQIDFESLSAKPDQLLSYSFWADDIAPDGTKRRTQGDLFFAEVRRFEEIFREGQPPPNSPSPPSPTAQKAEELAELQKQIIQATWKLLGRSQAGKDVPTDDIEVVTESQREALVQLEALAEKLSDPQSSEHVDETRLQMERAINSLNRAQVVDMQESLQTALAAERASLAGLLRLRAREFQVSRQQRKKSQSSSAGQQKKKRQLEELELDQEEDRYETQQQAQNSPEQQEQREVRQVLNRLKELAQRQEDLNDELVQLQSALQLAETEEEQEEIRRQLKRLRDQQQEILRETDELAERMQTPENQQRMSEASEKLEETREDVRQASEAMQREDASAALASGKRAERDLKEMRDDFRRETAGQFTDAMRQMREQAQQLDSKQEELQERMVQLDKPGKTAGLRGNNEREQIADELGKQQEKLEGLLNQMQTTVEEAETAEPLLAQNLYDAFRKTEQRQAEQQLSNAEELIREGFDPQAREFEEQAAKAIDELREDVESAAESVLGDETQGLQRALGELERLQNALDQEVNEGLGKVPPRRRRGTGESPEDASDATNGEPQESPNGQGKPNDSKDEQQGRAGQGDEQQDSDQERESDKGQPSKGQPSQGKSDEPGEGQSEQAGEGKPSEGKPSEGKPSEGKPSEGKPSEGQPSEGQPSEGQPSEGQPSEGQPSGGQPGEKPGQSGQGSPSPEGSSEQSTERQDNQSQSRQGQSSTARSPGLRQSSSSQPGQRQSGQQQPGQQQMGGSQAAANAPAIASPMAGDGFREWSDGLRDVEEMVENPELKSRAAQIRQRARDVRVELKRHSKTPQWRLVEEMIAGPLRELKRDVSEELMRRSADKQSLVPIDRDPVPDEFADAVRRYYEQLGSGR